MKKWFVMGATVASLATALSAAEMTGVISDAHCGAKHDTASEAATKCVQGCLKGGAAPVLVSDGKVYKLSADSADKVKDYAGQSVKVEGSVDGDTVTVNSVSPAK